MTLDQALLKAHALNPEKSDWLTTIQVAMEFAKNDPELKAEMLGMVSPIFEPGGNVVPIDGRKTI